LRITYPKSFLKLLLLGFTLAMLPLLFAFVNAAIYLDRLAEQSHNTVTQSVQATKVSKSMLEQLTLMERSARQFFVLHDAQLLDNFSHAYTQFETAVQQLKSIDMLDSQEEALDQLHTKASALYEHIRSLDPDNHDPNAALSAFIELTSMAQRITAENNVLIDQASTSLAETAELTRKMLIFQTLTLLPVALLVAGVITFLVAQPIRRMDAAIKKLGAGNYQEPISIDGPGDLHALGERLDWLRSQLEGLEQQKQRFLRHVSHELKTPLTSIREGSELLHDEVAGELAPQYREIASILRDSSLRLQKMIENLLNYTAVQYQKPHLLLEQVNLEAIITAILADYALTLSTKHIETHAALASIRIVGDKDKLHHVFDNLLSNAIKYTPQFGKINLSLSVQENKAIFEILDGGPGIMASDKARIFDPFYRGSGVYESLVSGSGLGLSIAKEYVDAHHGEIILLPSEQGAHFRVTLPLNPDNRPEHIEEVK